MLTSKTLSKQMDEQMLLLKKDCCKMNKEFSWSLILYSLITVNNKTTPVLFVSIL